MIPGEVQFWQKVSADLGIDVITPFETTLTDGTRVEVSVLVKDFGAKRGMVVNASYGMIAPYAKKLVEDGYGFSSNFGESPESYDRDSMIEILADWGWSGDPAKKPNWLL
ncbi:MAG TPA: hypothetical protein VEU95_16335 [Micropepsaceae bacterium]|nr:hypothetical protein [Micropepsaceae bacterium]